MCVAALSQLSTADRELLLLLAWEGLTPEQAATVLDVSRNALAVRIYRARQRLEAHLNSPGPHLRTVPANGQSHA